MTLTAEQQRIAEWLKASRPESETQEALAEDIRRVIPDWKITRDRYSKYESGSLPVGKKVLARFVTYWATRGVGGPDMTPRRAAEPEPAPDPLIVALTAQTAQLKRLADQIQRLVDDPSRDRLLVETIADAVGESVRATLQVAGLGDGTPQS